ncbi:A/G-specific adenine glycosylase [Amedibacillus sp. YH-ame6]
MIKQHDKQQFTTQLLAWYKQHARILPWREDNSAYRVWVSEIMLQQTRVEAVKPYFERFLSALPTLQDLACAGDDELAKLWEGLGYYNRVRNMKKCAQRCVEEFDGQLPNTSTLLKTLPGIGDYTAGAVASIAYGENIPAVDGNVLRVFTRVLVCEDDILKETTKKKFQNIIQDYMPEGRSADFNQALMELGALICVPNAAPRCNICPVSDQCLGYQSGQAQRLPNKTQKKKRRIEQKTILVLVNNKNIYLQQRPKEGLLANLYEFMNHEGFLKKKDLQEHIKGIKKITKLPNAKHIFSHIEWQMHGFFVEVEHMNQEGIWCTMEDIDHRYAIPTAYKVYREALVEWYKEK